MSNWSQACANARRPKTRAAIQAAALHLFERQGYDATTVDEIAERAEISQSTFFRYFPTKEDVVLHDRYDPLLLADFRAQPHELSSIAALRRTLRSVLGTLPADEFARERERATLITRPGPPRANAGPAREHAPTTHRRSRRADRSVPRGPSRPRSHRRSARGIDLGNAHRQPGTGRRLPRADGRSPRPPRDRLRDLTSNQTSAVRWPAARRAAWSDCRFRHPPAPSRSP